jgi:hypothetical protein
MYGEMHNPLSTLRAEFEFFLSSRGFLLLAFMVRSERLVLRAAVMDPDSFATGSNQHTAQRG